MTAAAGQPSFVALVPPLGVLVVPLNSSNSMYAKGVACVSWLRQCKLAIQSCGIVC